MTALYNIEGRAVAYIENDGESIYLYGGAPIAWLSDDSLYSFSGKHLGWYQDGWILDHAGNCVFFTENSTGGPARPAKQATPARGAKGARPARGARGEKPLRPTKSLSWSNLSDERFFDQ